MIPNILYRGDSDFFGTRNLKATCDHGQLQSSLISGGVGKEIFTEPLTNLIKKHVHPGWEKSHFLSFSENENVGVYYAKYHLDKSLDYFQFGGNGQNWDFAIIEFNALLLTRITQLEPGIYDGYFKPALNYFTRYTDIYRILIVDTVSFLKNLPSNQISADSLKFAIRDKEWLILPATFVALNSNKIEFSGILDTNCIGTITKFSKSMNDENTGFF